MAGCLTVVFARLCMTCQDRFPSLCDISRCAAERKCNVETLLENFWLVPLCIATHKCIVVVNVITSVQLRRLTLQFHAQKQGDMAKYV